MPPRLDPWTSQDSQTTIALSALGTTSREELISSRPKRSFRLSSGHSFEDKAFTNPATSNRYGVPATKPRISWSDILVVAITISCCSLAVAVVAHNHLAWWLGVTYQLVVIGFLLSIMNICLSFIAPTFFLLCETRVGRSVLQNYDAILRGSPIGAGIGYSWRTILLLLSILPLGISAGYKLFTGGSSATAIRPGQPLYGSDFGMYAPPGLQLISQPTGISLMLNATMPFMEATSVNSSKIGTDETFGSPIWDPPLPRFPQAYGFNTLLLGEQTAAMLDVPNPDWLTYVQRSLLSGESWNITAEVTATVALYNDTVDIHRRSIKDSKFWQSYSNQGSFYSMVLYNGWNVGLLANTYGPDESWAFIGIYPDPRSSLESFASVAKMYGIVRAPCHGTWTVTRGAIELVAGGCDLSQDHESGYGKNQSIFANNSLVPLTLGDFYMPTMMEFLAPFATTRNESHWQNATVSVVAASMLWSKATSVAGPGRQDFASRGFSNAGLKYTTPPTISSARPTLKRSWCLFVLLALQPLATLAMVAASVALFKVPIGKGFGLIAVLAGIDPHTLGILNGAAFSGKIAEQVMLHVNVVDQGPKSGRILYTLGELDDNAKASVRPRLRYS